MPKPLTLSPAYAAAYATALTAGRSEHNARWDAAVADVRADRAPMTCGHDGPATTATDCGPACWQ